MTRCSLFLQFKFFFFLALFIVLYFVLNYHKQLISIVYFEVTPFSTELLLHFESFLQNLTSTGH